jgi:proline iminopeptidase
VVHEEFMMLRGLKIYTKRIGIGVPLVFLHGGPGGEHRYFLPHLEGLANTFELVFYDQRGCGLSEEPCNKDYIFEEEVETLEALRKSLGLEKLNLVGESWGSMLSLLYASKYPQNVNKIFMTAAVGATAEGYLRFGKLLEDRLTPQDKQSLEQLISKLQAGEIEVSEIFKVLDPYYLFSDEHLVRKTKTKSNAEVNQLLGKEIRELYTDSVKPELLTDIPIMIAQGDSDIITPHELDELFLKHIPHTQLVTLKNCGHWSVIEKPYELRDLIEEFFKEI